jgi:hypothetical protein
MNWWKWTLSVLAAIMLYNQVAATLQGRPGAYLYNVAVSIDLFANSVVFGGDPTETISSRLGKHQGAQVERLDDAARFAVAEAICWLLSLVDDDHCKNSIDDKDGDEAIRP